eukprot:UN05858
MLTMTNVAAVIGTVIAVAYPVWYLLYGKKTHHFLHGYLLLKGFEIYTMRAEEYDYCIKLAAECFSENNPGIVALGITGEEWDKFARRDVTKEKCVDSGLSLVCKRISDGKIASFIFNKKYDVSKIIPGYKEFLKNNKAWT